MTSEPTVFVHRTPDELAESVCGRLVTTLVEAQSAGRMPHLVLTGGSIADRIHAAIASSPARDAVDWSRVEVWWGDERFLPSGHPDRNETQARGALLDHLRLDPARVHPMLSSDAAHDDPDRAASHYVDELAAAAHPEDHGDIPTFDVVMLGVGPDGHVASLFPEKPALYEERAAVAVRGSPKPPPIRVTLTLRALRNAREVWFVVAGDDKAKAVHLALTGTGVVQVPAAGPHGLQRTLWLLDRAAASQLPAGLTRLASP
ncbi:MAG: 6-phosphogluconolactonase [Propionibacteriales bacterium]|nr:6-phosphogluconolactonase [Propionibacteriales bacterium]